MTPEREAHLFRIKAAFLRELDAKYRAGQQEHGGNLFDHTAVWLVEQAMQEAVDLYTYLYTLRERLQFVDGEDCVSGNQRESQLHCHCGKTYELVRDETLPTGRTYREVR